MPDLKFSSWSIDAAAFVNFNGIKTFLADGLSTIFIKSKPVFTNHCTKIEVFY